MKRMLVHVLAAVMAVPLMADVRHTISVERMDGLESFVERALQATKLPFEFVEAEKQSDWKANLARMRSEYGEILYKQKMGRNETHRLELRNVAQEKVVVWHAFPLRSDDASRERAAQEFAAKVKKAMGKITAEGQGQ